MEKTKRFTLVSFVLAFFIAIVGFGIIGNANKTVKAEDTYVAQVGDVGIASLDEVFEYIAENDGVTVKFISNVVADKSYQVPAGVTTTFDLAGNTLSCAMTQTTGNQFILNDGNLTIKDSVGGGKISYTDLGNGGEYISDTIYNRANLVINGGAIENLSSATVAKNGYPHAVDTYSGIRDTSVTINGGTVYCANYSAIRMFCVSATYKADLVINGGVIKGAIDMQNGTKNSALGTLTIKDGTFNITANANNIRFANWNVGATEYGISASIVGGTFKGGITTAYVPSVSGFDYGIISGGTFGVDVSDYCADGYEVVENADNTFGVVEEVTAVAKIGGQGYATLAEALTAAKTMTGDVTVEILDKVTLNSSLSGNYDSITFAGADTDAEIYLDVQGYITATGKTVAFEDLILSKAEGGYIGNAGFMNVAFGVYDVNKVTYTNCTFSNGAYASAGNVTFTGCTFYRSYDKYGLWAYGNVDVTVDDCIFDDYRGIKMYAEGAAKTVDLTVKNTDFSAVNNKPAIVLTYGESVTLDGNTYSDTGVFELDLDGAPNGTAITSNDAITCKNDNGACGVIVDGKIYTTVAQAAEVAKAGSTVTLLHDSTETVELVEGVTLDKNGYTADGVTVAVGLILEGAGTEESPYLVATIDDLFNLSDMVNNGNNYNNEYFKLTQNIDLSEVVALYSDEDYSNWTPIGTKDNPFMGTFDGDGKTISNLVVVGENNVGFIGYANQATIKNVNIVNATVTGVDCVGAVAGQVYSVSEITNCHVSGLIKIEGQTNVGGIVGKYYTKVNNSSVIGDGTSTSYVKGVYVASNYEGDNVGGIMGHCGENNNLSNNVVKNITISGTRKVGGIVGIADQNTDVTSCTVYNVIIETTATADYANSNVKTMSIGGLIGQYQAAGSSVDGTVTGSSVSNVTFANANDVTVSIGAVVGGARGGSTGMLAPSESIVTSDNYIEMDTITGTNNEYLLTFVAQIGEVKYLTLSDAISNAQSGDVVEIFAGTIEEGTIMFPATLSNVTIKGAENNTTILKNTIIQSADGSSISYEDITIDGIVFDGSYILMTGWRTGSVTYKDWTITNCQFLNVVDTKNNAAVHFNTSAAEAVENFTFTNNVIDGVSGSSNSGVYLQATGDVLIQGNVINNVAFRPFVIQISVGDGTDDSFIVTENTFSGSSVGRAQGLGDSATGTDTVTIEVTNNIFKDITNAQQICYWNFNEETTSSDLSGNYFDINIEENPSKIYYNKSCTSTNDLYKAGLTSYYKELNADGTINKNSNVDVKFVVAKIGDATYSTLSEAFAAVQNAEVIELLADVELSETITFSEDGTYTLDGNGYKIIPSSSTNVTNSVFNLGLGSNDTVSSRNYIFTNVTFDGWTGTDHVLRFQGVTATLDNVTVTNCVQTGTTSSTLGLVTFTSSKAYVYNSTFTNNTCKEVIDFNSWANGGVDTITIDNCTFTDNEVYGTAVMYYAVGGGYTLTNSKFIGNEISSSGAAVLYFSSDATEITNNVFDGNVINSTGERAGVLVCENIDTFSKNVFKNNTCNDVTYNATVVYKADTGTLDVSANYWDGGEADAVVGKEGTINCDSYYSDEALTNLVEVVKPVAKIGDVEYLTLQEALDAVQDGQTIVLLDNVVIESNVSLSKAGTITIDGNGKTITSTYANNETIACAILLGTTGASDSAAASHVYTIKNVTFDGFTGASLIRAEGVTFTLQDSVVQNNNVTIGYQGLFRLESTYATFTNVQFINNNVSTAISINYNSDNSESTTEIIDCTFEGNTASGAGIVYYATGSGLTVDGSEFNNNTVSTDGNAATLYAGFNTNVYVTNNAFIDNTVTTSNATSKRVAGGLFVGSYGADSYDYDISGNVFDGNSATINSGATAAAASVAFSDYQAGCDLSDNYWGGNEPVVGVDYTLERNQYEVEVNSYYQNYSVATDGTITLEDKVSIMLKIGNVSFATMAEAVEYANETGITDLVITIVGTNTKDEAIALGDSLYLYETPRFDNVTIKQDNGNMPYYIDTIYTGDRTSADGKFVFDGVNIVITGQVIFEDEVRLINNSIIKRTDSAKNFIYYSNVVIEPGSKYESQIDDILGGTVTVDGGKTDGTYNETPDFKSIYFDVRAGQTFTLTNGAYALINSANEIGRLTLDGNVVVDNSKLEVFNNIPFGTNAYLNIIGNSYVQAKVITGSGLIEIDASNITTDTLVIKADMSGYTGMVEAINNDGAYIEITSEGVMVKIGVAEVNGVVYATLAEAIAAASVNGDTVYILADVNEEIADFSNVTLATNVSGGVIVTSTYADYVDFNNVTVANGVTLNIPNVLASGDVDNVIEGTLNVSSVYYNRYNATTIIRNGGKVTTGGMTIVRYNTDANAGMYIYGDNDDTTVEFSCANTIGIYSGTFYAENAVIEANQIWIDFGKSGAEPDEYAQMNAEFVNSIVRVTAELKLYKDASLTLTGTNLTAKDVQVRDNATPVVEMDSNSSITANIVTNLNNAKLNAKLDENNNVTFFVPVASVNGKNYASVQEALTNAEANSTITLLANVTLTETLSINKDITLDLNTYTITTGEENVSFDAIQTSANVTITNGTINSYRTGTTTGMIKVLSGNLTLTDATLINEGKNALRVQYGATASITNCTVTGSVSGGAPQVIIINDGTFNGSVSNALIYNGTFNGTINSGLIYGGTFVADVTSFCADGYYAKDNGDGTWTVVETPYIAEVNGVQYKTITEAIANANAGDTVTVLESWAGEGLVIGKGIILDLNGNTYTLTTSVGSTNTQTNGIQVLAEAGEVTIKNGTIAMIEDKNGDTYTFFTLIQNYANLTIDNATLDCENGVVTETAGFTGINVTAGSLTMTNGASIINCDKEGFTAIYVADNANYAGGASVEIQETTGLISGAIASDGADNVSVEISGGTFTQEVNKDFCADTFTPVTNTDGTYGVGILPEAQVENLGAIEVKEYQIYGSLGNVITDNPILLQLAMRFTAQDDETSATNNAYGQYITDFYITMDGAANGSFIANGCYLAGEYGEFGWIMIPLDGMEVVNGKAYPVITSVGFEFTYIDICDIVKVFTCGIYFSPEVLEANPNLGVNLTLGLSEDIDSAQKVEDVITVGGYGYEAEDFVVAATVDGVAYKTFAEALNAVVENSTLTLYSDVEISEPINVTNDLIIDGNGFSLTYTGNSRVIDVPKTVVADLTVKDLEIVTSGYSQRGINYNSPNGTLTLDNVTINGDHVTYAINLPGSANNVTVNITNSTIKGLIALNVWGQNSTINVTNTALISVDNAEHENYTAIALNNDGTTIANGTIVTVTGGSITALDENGEESTAVRNATQTGEVNISNTTVVVGTISEVVAIVDYGANEFYSFRTLQDAIDKATKDGATVKLLKDIELTETVVVSAGKPITLDLNGFNITYTVNEVVTANRHAIVNNGTLTLVNSSEENNDAEICLTYTPTTNSGYSVSTIGNNGTLNVESAYINCVNGGNNISYAIDNYSTIGDAVINVTGGCVYGGASGYSIRMFANDTTNNNELNVTGGTIWYVWAQNPNANANKVEINVEGGTVGYVYVSAVNETCNCENVTLNLKADCMEYAPATGTIPEDYTLEIVEGYYTLVKHNYVAEVNGVKYESLQEAIDNASVGATVKLLKNIELTETVVVSAGKAATLDLNGFAIAGTTNASKNYELIKNSGTLTVKDSVGSGKITLTATKDNGYGAYSTVISNNVGATLTIESGTIEHLGGSTMAYAIDNLTNGKGTSAVTVINGGTLESTYIAIRQFLNGIEANNSLTINGGTIGGANSSIYFQSPSAQANSGSLTITEDAIVNNRVYFGLEDGTTEWPVEVSIAEVALKGEKKITDGGIPFGYELITEDGIIGVERTFKFATYSLTLNGTIDVNVYAEIGGTIATNAEAYIVATMNGEIVASEYVTKIIEKGHDANGRYRFTIPVAAAYMTTDIEVQLYIGEEAVGNKMAVSVKKYADYVFANADSFSTELKDTMTALLNYGARAQLLFGVNTGNLAADASQDITSVTTDTLSGVAAAKITGSVTNVAVRTVSLLLESTTTIRVYFNVSGSIDGYTFKVDGVEVDQVYKATETVYMIEVDDILAADLDKVYTVTVSDGTDTLSLEYSALNYVKSVVKNSASYSAQLVNAVKALYLYNQAAEAFVEANQ